jgi:hypothetical protein
MHDVRLAQLRLLLFASLALGCSVASISGTVSAVSAAAPATASVQHA